MNHNVYKNLQYSFRNIRETNDPDIGLFTSLNSKIPLPLMLFSLFFLFFISCRQGVDEKEVLFEDFEVHEIFEELSDIKEIFYDMYSPVETYRFFEKFNSVFEPAILNPPGNVYRYTTSNKIAVNIGIYGADMSFCFMFGQSQESINYLFTIYRLAENLGISDSFISNTSDARSILYNQDSLFNMAGRIYLNADKQLKKSDREGAAALILAGGWIEALYIAGNFYDKNDPDLLLVEQILSQKYSLDRLIALLATHQKNEMVSRYLLMLRQLKNIYERVAIMFEKDDLRIDTTKRTIEAREPVFSYAENDIEDIISLVNLIRRDMIK